VQGFFFFFFRWTARGSHSGGGGADADTNALPHSQLPYACGRAVPPYRDASKVRSPGAGRGNGTAAFYFPRLAQPPGKDEDAETFGFFFLMTGRGFGIELTAQRAGAEAAPHDTRSRSPTPRRRPSPDPSLARRCEWRMDVGVKL